MEETNENNQLLKQAIFDYYMGQIKDKFSFLKNEEEEKISNSIMELADRKIEEKNSSINKIEIIDIMRGIMLDGSDRTLDNLIQNNIMDTFPDVATVTIEEGQTARVEEVKKKIFGEPESKLEYIFVSDEYYNENIQNIETSIKQFEKEFSSKDIEAFNEQFYKDATIKGYELENAREFESAMGQINQKDKKYEAVKDKMISDYGRKYQEILSRDISEQEKQNLLQQLLEETKSYASKSNEVATMLDIQRNEILQQFQNRAKDYDDIMKQIKKLNLFDKDAYIQERKGEVNPELARLYEKREELNRYRSEHEQPIYEVKPNLIENILNKLSKSKNDNQQLLLEYHPERDIPTAVNTIVNQNEKKVDEKLIQTLAHLYGEQVNKKDNMYLGDDSKQQEIIDTTDFEAHLVEYFRTHYDDIMEEGYNHFLSDFAEMPSEIERHKKEGELSKIAKQYGIDPNKFKCFGYKFSIREGLIYEEETALGRLEKIYYATDEGINSVIEDLYSKALYKEHSGADSMFVTDVRGVKNGFIEYAKQHGIKIKNEYTLETMEVNQDKVNEVSKYINEIVNKELSNGTEDYKQVDYTETIAQDISENYSTVMNLDSYNFSNLASVKNIVGERYLTDGYLRTNEDSILRTDEFSPRVVYATPEYCAREYANIMDKIDTLNATTNPFLDGYFDLQKANLMKDTLRTYIKEHDIDIDTSCKKQIPINQERIDMIADAMVERYGEQAKEPNTFRSSITQKLQDNWSEIMNEMQVVDVDKMFRDSFKEHTFIDDNLYVRDDFTYLGDFENFHSQCIYATPEALAETISKLDETIATRDSFMANREKKARNVLTQYAEEKGIKLDIPSLTSVKLRQQEDRMFGGLFNDMLPDDPTARRKIEANDTIFKILEKMSENIPGAISAMARLTKEDPMGFMLVLGLDDMNIRGSEIWQAYKYYCDEDIDKFKEAIKNRDADMVQFINEENAKVGGEKAVCGGASFDRSKKPDLYRFTEEDVELYRESKQEKREKVNKERAHKKFLEMKQKEQIEKDKTKLDKIKDKREEYKERKMQEGANNSFKKAIRDLSNYDEER